MSGLRLIVGLPIAAMVTFGIFMMMNGLIASDVELPEPRPVPDLVFTANPKPIDDFKPLKDFQQTTPTPPPAPKRQNQYTSKGKPRYKTQPVAITPDDITIDRQVAGTASLPIVRIEPAYPQRCADKGLEGNVLVEFDLSPDGSVVNPRILSSSSRCFDREALKAVARWKYSPSGSKVRNVRTSLTFQLAD